MALQALINLLGDEITDPEEESFLLFSQAFPSQNLGFVDSKATFLELTVGGKEFSIHQSPTILTSNRVEGTTGAVVWRVSPSFAAWMSSPQNVLFETEILSSSSTVLELGCGVSGIVALALGPYIGRYIATDQDYALKLLKQNIANNSATPSDPDPSKSRRNRNSQRKTTKATCVTDPENIQVIALDWELDSLHRLPDLLKAGDCSFHVSDREGVDAVVACDCIYNEALIEPFVKTCVDICRLRGEKPELKPTVCVVAQQLRSPEVFEAWLVAFHSAFHVWRVPDILLIKSLEQNSGFAVHVGTLRT